MTLGRKRNQVRLWKREIAVNAGGEHIEQFATVGTVWAEIRPRTAREVNGTVLVEENTYDFLMRYDGQAAKLRASDQITFRTDTYELTGNPMNIGGRDRELQIPVRFVTPSGVGNG